MLITAIQKFTTLDFPGKLACILFTGGCNMRCGYCHNADFVLPEKLTALGEGLPFQTVLNFLKKRRGKLDGVVLCGGEPTLQPDLIERLKQIKELGYSIKLDTNGTNPRILKKSLDEKLVDFVAMDIKDALPYRKELIGVTVDEKPIRESIKIIKKARIDHEFRTTIWTQFHDLVVLQAIGGEIAGADKWALQKGRHIKVLNPSFGEMREYSEVEMNVLAKELSGFVKKIEIRK